MARTQAQNTEAVTTAPEQTEQAMPESAMPAPGTGGNASGIDQRVARLERQMMQVHQVLSQIIGKLSRMDAERASTTEETAPQ